MRVHSTINKITDANASAAGGHNLCVMITRRIWAALPYMVIGSDTSISQLFLAT
jgi:hypothetical protein